MKALGKRQLIWVVAVVLLLGCRSAYYAAWEKVGVYKRDLLKERVTEARDEQKEAGEQFADALTHLQQLYGFEGGDLEKAYRVLQKDYERSASQAAQVRKRIKDVETVAGDLFAEWEKEMETISSANLRERSREQLAQTRQRYEDLLGALRRAEQSMEPVLVQFKDQVIFLKHNLNAQAIGSLRGEAASIQKEISSLIAEMNAAIKKADEFIGTLP